MSVSYKKAHRICKYLNGKRKKVRISHTCNFGILTSIIDFKKLSQEQSDTVGEEFLWEWLTAFFVGADYT